jgi:hypothetical protein
MARHNWYFSSSTNQHHWIKANCYRAFCSTDQTQDHNALLQSMHISAGNAIRTTMALSRDNCLCVGSNLGPPIALSTTATEHDYIGLH